MSAEEYIESGLLELYAAGALSVIEQQEVERMAATYPAVRAALNALMEDMETYASLHAVQPDASLREKIISAALTPKSEPVIMPLNPAKTNSGWKTFAIAASVMLLLSIGINFLLLTNANESNERISKLEIENQNLGDQRVKDRSEMGSMEAKILSMQEQMNFVRNPEAVSVDLNSVVDGHPMKAVVHWDAKSKMILIDPMSLPKTATDEMYVVWAIKDGKAINEGAFHVEDATGMIMMNEINDADIFAISLEKSPDVVEHVGPVYVLGKTNP
jgi:anti-sigma-K factor RskA